MFLSFWFSVASVLLSVLCLIFFIIRRNGDWRVRSFSSMTAVLLFICVMFSQDVNSTWLASVALSVFAVLSLVNTFIVVDGTSDFLAVTHSVIDVLRYVALGDLFVLVGLLLFERVLSV